MGMVGPLCLLQIHAHPDDEASKGAATMARYVDEGIRGVLVCCTGGEEGDIINKEMDRPEVKDNLGEVRRGELEDAVKIIGYDQLYLLGYRDSGMPDSEANARPDNFANAPHDEAVDRLATIIRAEQPQVLVTYGEDQSRYPHPDHLRVHDITAPAIERAADTKWQTGQNEPWQVSKLYYSHGFSRRRILAMHQWFLDNEQESPFAEWASKIADDHDSKVTTRVNVAEWLTVGREALLAHRTQVPPSGHWFRIPLPEMAVLHPWEEYQIATSLVGAGAVDEDGYETDLFTGLR